MLSLPIPDKTFLTSYANILLPQIRAEITSLETPFHNNVINFLTDQKIKVILTDTPEKLIVHHQNIITRLGNNFNIAGYEQYLAAKKKRDADKTNAERVIFSLYDTPVSNIKKVFNYDEFISGHKITSYWLAEKLDRNTCTYCNRLYTNTIIHKDENTGRVNDSTRLIRPHFDHWYSKSKYPVLALSFFNLIPSCSICNSSIKGDTDFELNTHFHPYFQDVSNGGFKYTYDQDSTKKVSVKVNATPGSKIEKSLKDFKVQEVYNAHSNFELKDMLDLKFKYSENYLDTLLNSTFKDLKLSKQEVYRLIFGVEYDEADFHKRPFSKFKKDILTELGVKL